MVDLKALQEFQLEAAAKTYAANAPKIKIPEFPGLKFQKYERGGYLYMDMWSSTGSVSYGQTFITIQDSPLWFMRYGGEWEDPELISFLKRALLAEPGFNGGRGPDEYREGSLVYINRVKRRDFTNFEGREFIYRLPNATPKFWHEYDGGLMVPGR